MKYCQWDIWDAWVAYEDDPSLKDKRPVLIYTGTAYAIVGYKITRTDRGDEGAEMRIMEWQKAGLDAPSSIRLHKVLPLREEDLVRKRGTLSAGDKLKFQIRISQLK